MSSLQNIELKTRKRAMQDVGSSGGGADSGTSSRGGRKSKTKKRNNNGNRRVSEVRSDKVAAPTPTPTPNADNHSPQANSKSGLQIQTSRRQEQQQKQRQHNESNISGDECDTLVGNISDDYDPQQGDELENCTIALNESSPILPIVLAESNVRVVVQIQPDQSPIGVSRENVNTNNRAQDQCLLDEEDAHDVGQTSQATRLLINSEQRILADLQASSSSSSSSSGSQFTKQQQQQQQRQQKQQQQKQLSASSKLIETRATGASEKLHSESKLAGSMNQMVLVQVDEDERATNSNDDGGELFQLVGRKLSQSSSGHASSGANSSSCWSTPVLQTSRRCSSVFAISDLKSNSKQCDINKNGHNNDTKHQQQQHPQFMPTTLATAISCHQDGAKLQQQEVANSLIKRSSSETDCGGGGGGSARGAITNSTNCNGQARVRSQRWRKATARQQPLSSAPIRRTISRSMLEFDSSLGANERFVVYWKNLTFAYKPGLFARLSGGGNQNKATKATATATEASPSPQQWPDYQQSNVVLNNVSGTIKSNQLVAIIGPSGCGKTTLLQFLAGNNGHQQDRLRIRGLGEPKVAFIGQDDTLLPGLTARETLMYASRLQNNAAKFDHAAHIQPILSELGLLECANRCVSKLSGGQAKRVTIGQELLYPTNLLILDEVTSGLDATTSLSIVKLLKYLVSDCSYPMSIVISIHQPSARLFAVFDKVYVMSAGNCLYEGSCNLTTINNHLSKFNLKCPKYHNMADYLIELASSLNGDDHQQQQQEQQHEPDDDSDSNCDDAQLAGKQYEVKWKQTMIDKQDRQANGAHHQCRQLSLTTRSHSNKMKESLSCNSTVLNQMIAVQRKQSQRWIEELESGTASPAASVTETVTDTIGDDDQDDDNDDDEHDDEDDDEDDGDDDATNGLIAAGGGGGGNTSGTTIDTSLYLAIEQAREQRLKPFMAHFRIHFERSLKRTRRSYILTYLQLIAYVIVGIQTATFYGADIGLQSGCPSLPSNLMTWILSSNSDGDGGGGGGGGGDAGGGQMNAGNEIRRIQENMNFLLVAVLTSTFAALEITVITFPLEAKTVKREWRNGWYRVTSYFMGRTLADLPLQVAFVMIFCALIYTLTGQLGLTTWRFAYFVLIIVMTALVAQSIGLIFGALFMNNLPAAVFTAPLAIFPSLLFSGFFSRVSQVPAFYVPLTYLSHFRYAFDALLVTLYGFNRCNCDQATLSNYHASLANQTSSMRDMFHLLFGASDCITGSGSGSATDSNQGPPAIVSSAAVESNYNAHSFGDNTIADSSGDGGGGNGGVISHDDLAAISASNQSLGSTLMSMIKTGGSSTTTLAPAVGASSINLNRQHPATSGGGSGRSFSASETYKQFEDMIVDTIFQQMSSSTPEPSSSGLLTNSSSLAAPTNDTLLMGNSTDGSGGGGGEPTSVMDRLADKFATKLTGMLNRQSNFGHPMPTKCSKFNSYLITEFDLSDDNLEFNLMMLFVAVLLTRLMCNVILHFTIATRIR